MRVGYAFALLLPAFSQAQHLTIYPQDVTLTGPDAGQQFVVLTEDNRDVTREVAFAFDAPDKVTIGESGFLRPSGNGSARITASLEGYAPVSTTVQVADFETPQPISFANDIIPVLTRSHCNAGACHAKATGQAGFQLSLLGYDPDADYEQMVLHGRGRRVSIAAPETSMLLMKPGGGMPHEGGVRWAPGSAEYQLIRRWISSGAPHHPDTDPKVERIEVFPENIITEPGAEQQLSVTAFFDNGTSRDITRIAQYESNQPELASANETGLVSLSDESGSRSLLVRFQEHIAVFMATVPLGHDIANLPEPNNFIDEYIFEKLKVIGLPPSDQTTDGAFLRRVTLGIAGRLPTIEETRNFVADERPDKRAIRIDELLGTTDYADYFASKWAALLRNKVNRGQEWSVRDSHAFHGWIRKSFLTNQPFDEFAAELIQASGKAIETPAVRWYGVIEDQKEQMQDISQVFLGVRMQCAQCHHHPYEVWSQDDYYAFAAFFSTVERKNVPKLPEEDLVFHNRSIAEFQNPVTEAMLRPRLLGDTESLEIPAERDPRRELATWVRSPDNPFFARTFVNRTWKHFFGRGLVEPEDDIRPTNPATHPELLAALADSFVESGFDVKQLIRTICGSRTYQLSSEANEFNGEDEQNYARFYPRRLQAEQLLDSVNDLTGSENSFNEQPTGLRAIALPNERANTQSEFLTMFGRPQMDVACECERSDTASLNQSLHLINSPTVQGKIGGGAGRAATFARDAERSNEEKLSDLYLQAYAREPLPDEAELALAHLTANEGSQQAWEDVIWVLLATKEFMFTH